MKEISGKEMMSASYDANGFGSPLPLTFAAQ